MNNEFNIPFVGLKVGKHYFEYEIKTSFFESMEYSIIHAGALEATLEFEKKEYDEINKYSRELEIDWFASCWDSDSLEFITNYDVPCV